MLACSLRSESLYCFAAFEQAPAQIIIAVRFYLLPFYLFHIVFAFDGVRLKLNAGHENHFGEFGLCEAPVSDMGNVVINNQSGFGHGVAARGHLSPAAGLKAPVPKIGYRVGQSETKFFSQVHGAVKSPVVNYFQTALRVESNGIDSAA